MRRLGVAGAGGRGITWFRVRRIEVGSGCWRLRAEELQGLGCGVLGFGFRV